MILQSQKENIHMKKLLALALAMLILASAIACNDTQTPAATTPAATTPAPTTPPSTPDEPAELSAGFGRVDITPAHTLSGLLQKEIETSSGTFANFVANNIYATTVAISDGETTILLITLDLRSMRQELYQRVVDAVTDETDIPQEQILIHTVHNHSAPELNILVGVEDMATLEKYEELIIEKIPESAMAAMEDLAPATMSIGRSETDRISFIRRYLLADGQWTSQVRDKTGKLNTAVAHEGELDEELQTLKLDREGAKDILMVNWQCHPAETSPYGSINADWIHYAREAVEEKQDAYFAFFQGTSGNINTSTYILSEKKIQETGVEKLKIIGAELAVAVDESLKDMEEIESGYIKIKFDEIHFKNSEQEGEVKLFIASIGDFALASNPFEMFCEQGKYVKDNSPAKMTFVVGLSNGYAGYLPPEEYYDHGGYEVECSRFKDDRDLANTIVVRTVNTIVRLRAR